VREVVAAARNDDARDAALRYVRDRLAEGRTPDEVLEALRIGGWSEQDARAVLRQAGAVPAPAPRPRSPVAAIAAAGCAIALILAFLVLATRGVPGAQRAIRSIGHGPDEACLSNMKQLGLAVQMYVHDYDERYPDAFEWPVLTQPYLKNLQVLICPRDPMPKTVSGLPWQQGGPLSYAFASDLSEARLAQIAAPAETPMLFDSDLVPDATWQQAAYRHDHGSLAHFAFADGHVQACTLDYVRALREDRGNPLVYGTPPPPPPTNRGGVAPRDFESLDVAESRDCQPQVRAMGRPGAPTRWVSGTQVFVTAREGGVLAYKLPVTLAGRYRLDLYATRAPDFATVRVTLDGRRMGRDVDLCAGDVSPSGCISLGAANLTPGEHALRFQVVGRNRASSGYNFGLDCADLYLSSD
jgi:prepilin-type processing-associated H-X9-DG protein